MPDLSTILTNVKNGIAKTNNYKITIPEFNLDFHGKGTQLPSSDLGVIEIPYKGRKLKVPGQRTFAEWTVTIMELENMGMRIEMEAWMNALDEALTGKLSEKLGTDMPDVDVAILGKNGKPTMSYKLYGVFPTSIASVDLNFDEQTAPLEYAVTFQYSFHTVTSGGYGKNAT